MQVCAHTCMQASVCMLGNEWMYSYIYTAGVCVFFQPYLVVCCYCCLVLLLYMPCAVKTFSQVVNVHDHYLQNNLQCLTNKN